jgi:hypothetical protein
VAYSPTGNHLATGSFDQSVRVWDTRTGQQAHILKGHTSGVKSVAFSPDGQRLASGSDDGTIKLWDVLTGHESLTLKAHTGYVNSIVFSPDGQRLASAGQDRTVKLWNATPLNEGSNLRLQALCYFRFVAETLALKDDMVRQIRQAPTLTEPVREQALAFLKDYREDPARLNDASWLVVRGAWARPGAYALALRQAEAAYRQAPGNGVYLRTLGAAQYRNNQHAAALETLTESDKRNATRVRRSAPIDLALLAMTHFQLGKRAEATAMLGRLREALKSSPFDRDAEDLLKEAESVVAAKK